MKILDQPRGTVYEDARKGFTEHFPSWVRAGMRPTELLVGNLFCGPDVEQAIKEATGPIINYTSELNIPILQAVNMWRIRLELIYQVYEIYI